MKISTKGRYALKVMIELAKSEEEDQFISVRDLAKRQGISIKYLEQIISLLNKAGYLSVLRGASGGYKLLKKPEEYYIGDILKATEGELSPTYCLTAQGKCSSKSTCETYAFWEGLDEVVNEYVNSKTLADLIK